LDGVDFLAAHNSSFDSSVLKSCCREAGVDCPQYPFRCTVKEARRAWGIYPTKLPDVCRYLGISLNHHDPLSDAMACAKIMIKILKS
jgi:DNA polymerase-3 subunit epsilon